MPQNINHRSETIDPATFFRTWGNPEQQYALTQSERAYRYRRLWDYYQGTAFDDLTSWGVYRREFGLYRAIRQVWDHTHQLVEFYATHIWSGSIAADGLTLPDGVENAIPLAPDTDEALAGALAQLWLWWNFQEQMTTIVRYTAALGEYLVELKDDTQRGKVLINTIWPSYIKDIKLDESGNVREYDIEYRVKDEDTNDTFTYRRTVDKEFITTYKDGEPFDYTTDPIPSGDQPYGEYVTGSGEGLDDDDGAQIPNPYGFVPAVWFRHIRMAGVRGEPAIWSTQGQLDEANQLFAHLLDKGHVSLEAPIVVSGNLAPNALQKALNQMAGTVKRAFTETLGGGPIAERETINVLEGPAGTRIETIELKISEAMEALDHIIASIEKKCPEITFYQELRSMTQLTGPGAQRVLGDVERTVRSIAGGYDRNLIRLSQMGVSMAAMRLAEGADGWENANAEQQKFADFDEGSFDAGELNFDIMPRSVVPINVKDKLELEQAKKNVLGDFIPPEVLAAELGYEPDVIKAWTARAEALKAEAEAALEKATVPEPTPIRRPAGAPAGGPQRGQQSQRRRSGPNTATARVG
jgi:hypothetical protein